MIDNFFSSQRPLFSLSNQVWNPPTDIYETDEVTKIKMEVAGLDERELEITVQGDMLVVRGRRALEPVDCKVNYHLMEVHYGQFERAFAFNHPLNDDLIKASYDQGFLVIDVRRPPARAAGVAVKVKQVVRKG